MHVFNQRLLSHPALLRSLQKLVFFERTTAHIQAGSLPKIRSLAVKKAIAGHVYETMTQAVRLRNLLFSIAYKTASELLVSEAWIRAMRAIDGLPSTEQTLHALYREVRPHILEEYHTLRRQSDPLLDQQLLEIIASYIPKAESHCAWAQTVFQTKSTFGLPEDYWRNLASAPDVPLDDSVWSPIDRVTSAMRPEGSNCGENGKLAVTPEDVLHDNTGIGIFLHNNISEEYATLELSARNSYEHPDLPWEFHLAMTRHVADEARHALIQERLAAEYGVNYGQYPINITNYDMLYSFPECERGSKRELLWRVLLRMTYQEGLAIDANAFEIERRLYLGQEKLAKTFHYLLVDELSHAEAGLHWSRVIAEKYGFDLLGERDKARTYYLSREINERLRYIVKKPRSALLEAKRFEAARKKNVLPIAMGHNLPLRRQAGYSEEDIEQLLKWRIYRSVGGTAS